MFYFAMLEGFGKANNVNLIICVVFPRQLASDRGGREAGGALGGHLTPCRPTSGSSWAERRILQTK